VDWTFDQIRASKHLPEIQQDDYPQSQIPKKQIVLTIAGHETYRTSIHVVGDQTQQLSLIDSADKRDTILQPSLDLRPNRSPLCALCG